VLSRDHYGLVAPASPGLREPPERRHPAGGAAHLGEGQPIEQAIAIMMDAHGRSAVHPDRIEGIGAFNEGREPTFKDSDF
jgi:hypothetical protein